MKLLRMMMLSAVAAATLTAALPAAPAFARDEFSFSFDVGNVRQGYRDGYWDTNHQWHHWRNERESRAFRERYQERYVHERHDRFRGGGWRDSDGDGVPDRLDAHPNNPHRD